MNAIDIIEKNRVEIQTALDAKKTPSERNKLGQFVTPSALAAEILEYARSLMLQERRVRFLDPAFGTGSFYLALLRTFPKQFIVDAAGHEVDPLYGAKAIELWRDTPLRLRICDFTELTPPTADKDKANLLICNPPYVRHHHLSTENKARLQKRVEQTSGMRLSGLAGLYCYFLGISHAWMARNGLAGWLIPSEFMDVNYGQQVKEYLLNRVTLLRIHRCDPNEVQFEDALVSSAVVWFRNTLPPANHTVEFTYGGTLATPKISKTFPTDMLRREGKWTALLFKSHNNQSSRNRLTLSHLFEIKRGLATGANGFFILNEEQAAEHRLPSEFLVPILPSPRYLAGDEIEADTEGNPITPHNLFLLSCKLPEHEIREKHPSLWAYLEKGIKRGLHKGYLCRHREPWYSQEQRPPSALLCTYMGRKRQSNDKPFRFILNHSKATAANVYLMLYPNTGLRSLLKSKPALYKDIWQALNDISPEVLINEARIYGGGLHKVEPKELANVPADKVLEVVLAAGEIDRYVQGQLF